MNQEKKMKKIVFAALILAVGLLSLGFYSTTSTAQEQKLRTAKGAIPGRYIVVLEDWATGARGFTSESKAVSTELTIVSAAKSTAFSNTLLTATRSK